MANCCVLGGGGFIGGHLAKKLLDRGHQVRAVDIKPRRDWWQWHQAVDNFAACDLRELPSCRVACKGATEVYQLAADMGGAGIVFSGDYDAEIMHNSAQINLNIAEMARMLKFRTFYSSSACIYPAHNQTDPNNPNCEESTAYPAACDSRYGWEKLFSEQLYDAYARNHKVHVRVARFHNIYGTCYDAETDILTRQGFKRFKDVTYHDELATRTDDGFIEYHTPLAIQQYPYSGMMYRFKSKYYDLLVTPDHELTVLQSRNSMSLQRVAAKDIKANGRDHFMVRKALWRGRERSEHEIPGVDFNRSVPFERRNRNGTTATITLARKKAGKTVAMDDWLEFLGWYLAEGCCIRRKQKPKTPTQAINYDHVVDVRNFDEQALREIESVIRRMGFTPQRCDGRIQVSSKALYEHLKPLGNAGDKFIPQYVRDLSSRQLRILFTSMMRGDGTTRNGQPRSYPSKSKRLAEDFLEVANKLGMGTTIRFDPGNPETHAGPKYVVGLSSQITVHKIAHDNVSNEEYSGMVYDVTVPNHTILVRRNGRCVWSGNCGSWQDGREKAPAAICRKVAQAKLTGEQRIEIWGDGTQTRSFCWIDDCVAGILSVMNGDNPAAVNLGSEEMVTINQLVDYVEEIAGVKLDRRYKLDAPTGVAGRCSDNTEFRRRHGWDPNTPLRAGLEKTYQWIEDQVKASL